MSTSTPWYGSPSSWGTVATGAAEGASSAMKGSDNLKKTKKDLKEAKRRNIANLMSTFENRRQGQFRMGQDYNDEMNDYQTQALQQIARNLVNSLQR